MDEHNNLFIPLVWPLSLNYTQAQLNRSYKDVFAMFLFSFFFFPFFSFSFFFFFFFFFTFLQFVVCIFVGCFNNKYNLNYPLFTLYILTRTDKNGNKHTEITSYPIKDTVR